jgi:hypothetical protein
VRWVAVTRISAVPPRCHLASFARLSANGGRLFGRAQNRWRVIRTSNPYTVVEPKPPAWPPGCSKSALPTGTGGQEPNLLTKRALDPENPLPSSSRAMGKDG